jgi:hypothetical protein
MAQIISDLLRLISREFSSCQTVVICVSSVLIGFMGIARRAVDVAIFVWTVRQGA